MKIITTYIFMNIALVLLSQEQFSPPILDLDGVDVNWVYLTKDTLFVPGSSSVTNYSSGSPRKLIASEDYIYHFNQSRDAAIDFDGFDIYMLDKDSGELLHSLNYDSYNIGDHYYIFNELSNLSFRDDGNLEILGYQSLDTFVDLTGNDWPVLFFFGNAVKFNLSADDLSILEKKVGSNSNMSSNNLFNLISPGTGDLIRDQKNNYFHLQRKGIIEEEFLKQIIYVHPIKDDFTIDSNFVKRIEFESFIQTNLLELSSPTLYKLINDSTLMTINFVKSLPDVSLSPEYAEMNIYSFDSFNELSLKNTVDITEFFVKDDGVHFFYTNIISDKIILSQTSFDPSQSPSNLEAHSWLAVFDLEGQLEYHTKDFGNDGLKYERLIPIFMEEENLVFSITFELDSITGFDLFKVNINSNYDPEKIARISQENDESFRFFGLDDPIRISQNSMVTLIRGRYEFTEKRTSNMTYVVSFNLDENILDNTESIEFENSFEYSIHPNPSLDFLTISFEDQFVGQIETYSSNGQFLDQVKCSNRKEITLNYSNFNSGTYIIKVRDSKGRCLKSSIFFKQ